MAKKHSLNQDDLKLFNNCPRCFYLSYKHGILRPTTKKKDILPPELDEAIVKNIKKVMAKGIPLPSPKCSFCIYRQLVRQTGVENDLST